MQRTYNIYCDESCHLEQDGHPIMIVGGVWCPEKKSYEISREIRELKERFNSRGEIKWIKVSPSRLNFFKKIIDYFFDNQDLHFRCLTVRNKEQLDHSAFNQGSHDTFYYKMYFSMLNAVLSPDNTYNIYIDIKDTRSHKRVEHLREVLCNNYYDFKGQMILKIQQIRSEESEIMQLADLLIGAIGYCNRMLTSSPAKNTIVEMVKRRSKLMLRKSTSLYNRKFNLFFFTPSSQGGCRD